MSAVIEAIKEKAEPIINSIIALIVGFIGGTLAIYVSGHDVGQAMYQLYIHSIGNPFENIYPLTVTLTYAGPLMLSGLAFALCARAGLFNIGVEGQIYMAALGAVIAASVAGLPAPVHALLIIVSAVAFAVAWSAIPAALKVFRDANEVVVTIMLNYIAFGVVDYIIFRYFPNPEDATKSIIIPSYARIPLLVPQTSLSWNIIISIAVLLVIYFLLWYTRPGYELRVAGTNPKAARYAGINPKKAMATSFILAGMLAGIAGLEKVAGLPPSYSVMSSLSNLQGLGIDGIAVSLIGGNHPLGIVFAAILVGALHAGARGLNLVGIPKEIVWVFQGMIVICLAVPNIYTLVKRKIAYLRGEEVVKE